MTEKEYDQRTGQQNKAIHLYCRIVSDMLNLNDIYVRSPNPERQYPWKTDVEIPFNKEIVKEDMWDKIMYVMFKKTSTTELTTKEVNEIYEVMSRHLGISSPSLSAKCRDITS